MLYGALKRCRGGHLILQLLREMLNNKDVDKKAANQRIVRQFMCHWDIVESKQGAAGTIIQGDVDIDNAYKDV